MYLTPRETRASGATSAMYHDITVQDFLQARTKKFRSRSMVYRSPGLEFSGRKHELPIPPYILGLWLGDGACDGASICSMDAPVIKEWLDYGRNLGMKVCELGTGYARAKTYYFSITDEDNACKYIKGDYRNKFNILLKSMQLIRNKHIPSIYKTASRNDRLELIAGLIDTDGSLGSNYFDFLNKNERLVEDMASVCRSVGLACYVKQCKKSCTRPDGSVFTGDYFRLGISGELSAVPTRLARKQAKNRKQAKSVSVSMLCMSRVGTGQVIEIEVSSSNRLCLLADYTTVVL
jgi:hypothetical protein